MTGELTVLAHHLANIARHDRRTCDYTTNSLRQALADVVACFPVYRTYVSAEDVATDDTRHVDWAIGLAKKRGMEVVERTILPEELGTFSECFLVGTAAEVTPVAEIAEHTYKPGKICETLIHDYTAAVQPKKQAAE